MTDRSENWLDAMHLLGQLHSMLPHLQSEEREEIFLLITDGYCKYCGDARPRGDFCHCTNDE